MTRQRIFLDVAERLVSLVLTSTTAILLLTSSGCSSHRTPAAPAAGTEVIGTLVAIQDARPVDGGVDLTLQTVQGTHELARVPSIFRVPPRDWVTAMHRVVDASKIGDRLRARGTRDESGALQVEFLEILSR